MDPDRRIGMRLEMRLTGHPVTIGSRGSTDLTFRFPGGSASPGSSSPFKTVGPGPVLLASERCWQLSTPVALR